MTIQDFIELFADDRFTLSVWNINSDSDNNGDTIWSGYANDLPIDFQDIKICYVDIPDKPYAITVNIDLSEDEVEEKKEMRKRDIINAGISAPANMTESAIYSRPYKFYDGVVNFWEPGYDYDDPDFWDDYPLEDEDSADFIRAVRSYDRIMREKEAEEMEDED